MVLDAVFRNPEDKPAVTTDQQPPVIAPQWPTRKPGVVPQFVQE
jgi:hypothetical protein